MDPTFGFGGPLNTLTAHGVGAGSGIILANAFLSGAIGAITRESNYQANARLKNLVPDPESTWRAYHAGLITPAVVTDVMSYHGIRWELGSPGGTSSRKTWDALAVLSKPWFPLEYYRGLYRQGKITPDRFADMMRHYGFGDAIHWNEYAAMTEPLSYSAIISAWLLGEMAERDAIIALSRLGISNPDARIILKSTRANLSVDMIIEMRNREHIFDGDMAAMLRKIGHTDPAVQAKIHDLRFQIPPYSDIQHLAVREAWDDAIAARYGYDDEIPVEYVRWARKIGLDWGEALPATDPAWAARPDLPPADMPPVPWWKLLWRAKWQPLSPSQSFEALHRFRGRVDRPDTWRINPATGEPQRPFTMNDVDDMLKIADYPTALRPILAGLSYNILRLVDIRKIYKTGLRDSEWMVGQLQDRGYTRNDAVLTVDSLDSESESATARIVERRVKRAEKRVLDETVEGYRLGWRTTDEVRQVYEEIGWTQREAGLAINATNLELANETARASIARAKTDYVSGRVTQPEVWARLRLAGIRDEYIGQLINRWNTMRTEPRVIASAAKVVEWGKAGYLTPTEVAERLRNLGYDGVDILILMTDIQNEVNTLAAKEVEANAKKRMAAARELERLAKEAAAIGERARNRLKSLTPVSTLRRWAMDGVITPEAFRSRMLAMGYPLETVQLYEVEIERKIQEEIDSDDARINGDPA